MTAPQIPPGGPAVPTPKPASASGSVTYVSGPPEGVSEAVRKALAPFSPTWCQHEPHADGSAWMGEGYAGALIEPGDWHAAHVALRQAGFLFLRDHTAVDYPDRPQRFTVVSLPLNPSTQEALIVKARLAEGQSIASLADIWHSADWAERETYDMFGIAFDGHPELTRIYMPQDYDGWPMRKDFPLRGHLRFVD